MLQQLSVVGSIVVLFLFVLVGSLSIAYFVFDEIFSLDVHREFSVVTTSVVLTLIGQGAMRRIFGMCREYGRCEGLHAAATMCAVEGPESLMELAKQQDCFPD